MKKQTTKDKEDFVSFFSNLFSYSSCKNDVSYFHNLLGNNNIKHKSINTFDHHSNKSIIIVGSGIIGVCSAYYLSRSGYNVTVIEKNKQSAMSTSFGNAGALRMSTFKPLATLSTIQTVLSSFKKKMGFSSFYNNTDNPKYLEFIKISPFHFIKEKTSIKWSCNFMLSCFQYSQIKTQLLHQMSEFSIYELLRVIQDENINLNTISYKRGCLVFYRSKNDWENACDSAKTNFMKYGNPTCSFHCFNKENTLEFEPGLKEISSQVYGSIYYPNDIIVDCFNFTQELSKICSDKYNVKFLYSTPVIDIKRDNNGNAIGVIINNNNSLETINADNIILCCGPDTTSFINNLSSFSRKEKRNSPKIYPLKGYSISLKHSNDYKEYIGRFKNSLIVDNSQRLYISNYNNETRFVGYGILSDNSNNKDEKLINNLSNAIKNLWPNTTKNKVSKYWFENTNKVIWMGRRPLSIDGVPCIMKHPTINNLYFNTAHGPIGFKLACASGVVLDSLISKEKSCYETTLPPLEKKLFSNVGWL